MKKKHGWLKVITIVAAIAGAAVAVAAFFRKKGKKIQEELDFDEEMYFDEDDYFEDDIMEGDETVAPKDDADEDMQPEESADAVSQEAADAQAEETNENEK